jgi:hypothetical protein
MLRVMYELKLVGSVLSSRKRHAATAKNGQPPRLTSTISANRPAILPNTWNNQNTSYNAPAWFISGNAKFLDVPLPPSGTIEYGHPQGCQI